MKYTIDTPGSLASRISDGRWKKLLVFVGQRFLPRPGVDYRFTGATLMLSQALDHNRDTIPVLVIVDPLDGDRWLYSEGKWERVGSLIA